MPSLTGATTWIGSPALSPSALRGKVVLVDFWTYSCINSLRQVPYLRAWAARCGNQGLVVIGVHSPEFGFEKNLDNVRTAVKDIAPGYPVAVDSDHAVWRAFDNEYWPALYIVDSQGRIRHHVFGEGEYEHTEAIIQTIAGRSRARRSARRSGQGGIRRRRGAGRLGPASYGRNLCRLRPGRWFLIARRHAAG